MARVARSLDWQPEPRHPVFLRGTRIALREWEPEDRGAVAAYAADEEVGRYLIRSPSELLAEPELALEEAHRPDRTDFSLAVVSVETETLIGSARLYVDNPRHHHGEIGYILGRDHWGRGLATEVASLLLRFGFSDLGLHRLWATCDPANRASARVLEKVGMVLEGHLREYYLAHDGTWRDALLYARLAAGTASGA